MLKMLFLQEQLENLSFLEWQTSWVLGLFAKGPGRMYGGLFVQESWLSLAGSLEWRDCSLLKQQG